MMDESWLAVKNGEWTENSEYGGLIERGALQ